MRSALLLLFLSSSCVGQQFIKGGLSLAHSTGAAPYGTVRRTISGFTVGVLFNRELTDWAFFRPEIAFIQKGERVTTSTEELRARLNYIEAPLLIAVSVVNEPQVVLLLEGGPSFSYGVGGNYKVTSPGNSRNGAIKFGTKPSGSNTSDVYLDNAFDFGVQFGCALVVKERLLFDLRYGAGLSSFLDPPDPLPAGSVRSDFLTYNRTVQFTIGWGRQRRTSDSY